MKDKLGRPMMIVSRIPHGKELASVAMPELSKAARFRISVFDYYFLESARFSANGKPNASITCRRFGIHRSYFYRWMKRYNKHDLTSLENRPSAPKKKRTPTYSWEVICAVRNIRKQDATYSAKKIRPILLRSMDALQVPSVATIGRLIQREKLFFRPNLSHRKKHARAAKALHAKTRKPYGLKADGARQIVEFDMKHVYLLGRKHYAFCAVDPYTKEAVIHVASTPSSLNAKTALEKVIARFGKNISVVNDNGSENMGKAATLLAEKGITQYWTKPHSPKEKPFIERLIGTLQKECLDYHYEPMGAAELGEIVDEWLDKYHSYRPHEALGFMTPAEYCGTLGLSIPMTRVS